MSRIYTQSEFTKDIELLHEDLVAGKDMWWPDKIVGIVRGGCVPAVYLSHLSGINCDCFVWQLRDSGEREHRYDLIDDFIGEDGKNVLIIDDINDTGDTFQTIWDDWTYNGTEKMEKHLRFACLFHRHTSKFNADYNVNYLKTDEWVVFPWEKV